MVTGYRAYMLLSPQVHLVSAADTGIFGAGRIAATEPNLRSRIDAISDPAKKAQAQPPTATCSPRPAPPPIGFAGVGDIVLGLQPADVPAGQGTFAAERAKVTSGRVALATAAQDEKVIGSLLA